MATGSREKVFLVVCGGVFSMFFAGTSLFSQPPMFDAVHQPAEAPVPRSEPVIQLAWSDLASQVNQNQVNVESRIDRHLEGRRSPAVSPVDLPFGDMNRLWIPWTSPLDPAEFADLRFQSIEIDEPDPPRPILTFSPPVVAAPAVRREAPRPLVMLKDLKITGLFIAPDSRAVRLQGVRLKQDECFDVEGGRVVVRKQGGIFRVAEIRPESIVIEHLPSASRIIRSCDRKRR